MRCYIKILYYKHRKMLNQFNIKFNIQINIRERKIKERDNLKFFLLNRNSKKNKIFIG